MPPVAAPSASLLFRTPPWWGRRIIIVVPSSRPRFLAPPRAAAASGLHEADDPDNKRCGPDNAANDQYHLPGQSAAAVRAARRLFPHARSAATGAAPADDVLRRRAGRHDS